MALNKQELKANIKQLLEDMLERSEQSTEEFAERLSTAIDDYVKQAQINYTSGLTAPNGAVAGTFNGNLS
jgi:hypothetical protein